MSFFVYLIASPSWNESQFERLGVMSWGMGSGQGYSRGFVDRFADFEMHTAQLEPDHYLFPCEACGIMHV